MKKDNGLVTIVHPIISTLTVLLDKRTKDQLFVTLQHSPIMTCTNTLDDFAIVGTHV